MSYDIKFKQRALEYQREGYTYKETYKVFKMSEKTLTRNNKSLEEAIYKLF